MSFFSIISLLFLGNLSSEIEKENTILKEKIKFSKEQFNINQIEYSLVTNYDYLFKLKNIYIDDSNRELEAFCIKKYCKPDQIVKKYP